MVQKQLDNSNYDRYSSSADTTSDLENNKMSDDDQNPPEENNYTVPQDPEVRRRIREHVREAAAQHVLIDGYRENIKEIAKNAEEELEVPKKVFNKMVTAFRKDKFRQMSNDNEIFEEFYEKIMEDTTAA